MFMCEFLSQFLMRMLTIIVSREVTNVQTGGKLGSGGAGELKYFVACCTHCLIDDRWNSLEVLSAGWVCL